MLDLDWLHAEAERLGLELADEDLEAIRLIVEPVQRDLARLRPLTAETLEPPYRFAPLETRSDD
jgi:hypothetical protein